MRRSLASKVTVSGCVRYIKLFSSPEDAARHPNLSSRLQVRLLRNTDRKSVWQEVLFLYKTRAWTVQGEISLQFRHNNFQPLRKYRGALFTHWNTRLHVMFTVKKSRRGSSFSGSTVEKLTGSKTAFVEKKKAHVSKKHRLYQNSTVCIDKLLEEGKRHSRCFLLSTTTRMFKGKIHPF